MAILPTPIAHNFASGSWVAYTGTHDNATAIGWWQELSDERRRQVEAVLGHPLKHPVGSCCVWRWLHCGFGGGAPAGLDEPGDEARFNTPGTASGNWSWQLPGELDGLDGHLSGLQQLAACYDRGSGRPKAARNRCWAWLDRL